MNYRKFYEEQTKTKLPKHFDVHHIDHDRTNNSIENLIAIPKNIHQKYHWYFNQISGFETKEIVINVNPHSYLSIMNNLNKYCEIMEEMHKFLMFRNYLIDKNTFNYYNYNYSTIINI